ncbi:hypothetical protein [Pseudolactococcus carnosus]|uniref:Uncharacterized protein n=1 Tax=Pseudolactococcus carnosus TaxID=2749961 RepID=A0ABT0AR21_9LACT|nr:hypothetical protein [Lactococcus carnosus]MCJ1989096.1 hypothetical protein [Lactococcus carnosus]
MKIEKKLRVCLFEAGEVSETIPEHLKIWVLEKYVQSNGWDCSGSAFSNEDTFVIWLDVNSENKRELHDFIPDIGIKREVLKKIKQKNNWVALNYTIVVETFVE